jgi:hypothetical protein
MTSFATSPALTSPRAIAASVEADQLRVKVHDGREISVPVAWFEFLVRAGEDERADLQIIGGGAGLWWEQLEDGISVPQLFGLPPDD